MHRLSISLPGYEGVQEPEELPAAATPEARRDGLAGGDVMTGSPFRVRVTREHLPPQGTLDGLAYVERFHLSSRTMLLALIISHSVPGTPGRHDEGARHDPSFFAR